MWIHLVALGLINGAGSGALPPPDVQQFIHFQAKGSNSSTAARKRWADKQQAVEAQIKSVTAKEDAASTELAVLKAGLQPVQTTGTTKLNRAEKALLQQQVLEAFRQALVNEQQTAQWLFERDEDEALAILLLSL